jgi:hypothetical protein
MLFRKLLKKKDRNLLNQASNSKTALIQNILLLVSN